MIFLVATFTLALVFVAGICSARRRSVFFFFWIFSTLFFFLPAFIDVFMISVINSPAYFENLITSRYLGQANNITDPPYLEALVAAGVFSAAVFMVQLLVSKNHSKNRELYLYPFDVRALYILAAVDVFFLLVFVFFNEKFWFSKSFFVPQSAVSYRASFIVLILSGLLIPALHQKRLLLFLVFFCGPLIISMGTSQRPWALATFATLIFYVIALDKGGKLPVRKIFGACIIGSFAMFVLHAVRHGIDVVYADMFFWRDFSYFSALYVFSEKEVFSSITDGSALLFLLQSGWVPDHLKIGSYSELNIPLLIAEEQMGWQVGSVHPTIFGWSYADLGNLAFLVGIVIAVIYSLIERLLYRVHPSVLVLLVPATAFSFSAMVRGTVQRGWSSFVFMAVLILLVAIIFRLSRSVTSVKRGH